MIVTPSTQPYSIPYAIIPTIINIMAEANKTLKMGSYKPSTIN